MIKKNKGIKKKHQLLKFLTEQNIKSTCLLTLFTFLAFIYCVNWSQWFNFKLLKYFLYAITCQLSSYVCEEFSKTAYSNDLTRYNYKKHLHWPCIYHLSFTSIQWRTLKTIFNLIFSIVGLSILKTKRKVWCVLEESQCKLQYYKNEEELHQNKTPLGNINIKGAGISLDLDTPNQFIIM